MRWSIWAAAAALTTTVVYRIAAESGFSTEGMVFWIMGALFGAAFGIWVYERWRMRGRWGPRPY
jgi:hypothetical protein